MAGPPRLEVGRVGYPPRLTSQGTRLIGATAHAQRHVGAAFTEQTVTGQCNALRCCFGAAADRRGYRLRV